MSLQSLYTQPHSFLFTEFLPAVGGVADRLCHHHRVLHRQLLPQPQVTEGVVKDLLLVAKVEHEVPVKLVTQGRADGLNVSDVIANTRPITLTLHT